MFYEVKSIIRFFVANNTNKVTLGEIFNTLCVVWGDAKCVAEGF